MLWLWLDEVDVAMGWGIPLVIVGAGVFVGVVSLVADDDVFEVVVEFAGVVFAVLFISFSRIFLNCELLSVATDSLMTVSGRLDAGISGTAAAAIVF